jgi:hypothetical protein
MALLGGSIALGKPIAGGSVQHAAQDERKGCGALHQTNEELARAAVRFARARKETDEPVQEHIMAGGARPFHDPDLNRMLKGRKSAGLTRAVQKNPHASEPRPRGSGGC